MLIPYGTDAPLSRPPWGTLALIVANIFLFTIQDSITPRSWYVLDFGKGLHPIQWVLAAFAHAGPGHLIGNMIFLFSFGIVVESMMKLRHFFLLYFAIAVIENILVQVLMLGSRGGALGASGVIFGLMMVASFGAPDKNIKWFFWHFYLRQAVSFEVPVLMVGLFYFLWDFGAAMFDGFAMSTPFLHSIGAIVGMGVGIAAYYLNWFEFDGDDLVSRFIKLFGGDSPVEPNERIPLPAPRRIKFADLDQQVALLDQYLPKRNYPLIKMKLAQIKHDHEEYELSERQLVSLINIGTVEQDWHAVLGWMDNYLAQFETLATTVALNKARIQSVALQAPLAARKTLATIQRSTLDDAQRTQFQRIAKRTLRQLNEGVIELQEVS